MIWEWVGLGMCRLGVWHVVFGSSSITAASSTRTGESLMMSIVCWRMFHAMSSERMFKTSPGVDGACACGKSSGVVVVSLTRKQCAWIQVTS